MEVAKLRAARMLWHRIMDGLGAKDERSQDAAHPLPDLGRVADRAGPLQQRHPHHDRGDGGGARRHPDRSTPTRSTRRSRCRPISRPGSPATPSSCCQEETGMTNVVDPLGGIYLCREPDAGAGRQGLGDHRAGRGEGGMAEAVAAGMAQGDDRGSLGGPRGAGRPRRGRDRRRQQIPAAGRGADRHPRSRQRHGARRRRSRGSSGCSAERDEAKCRAALDALREGAKGDAQPARPRGRGARARATLGEISLALEDVFGRYGTNADAGPRHLWRRL